VLRYIVAVPLQASQFAALADFRHQVRRFLHFSEQAARAAGFEPRQHQLLLALKGSREPHPTIGALAERLQIRHHSAVELINRMVRHGWVRRVHSREDRRRVEVRLTRSGNAALGRLSATHLRELRQTGPALVSALEALIPSRRGAE
jgi:DNA-binding MarR family transcriptional regulator